MIAVGVLMFLLCLSVGYDTGMIEIEELSADFDRLLAKLEVRLERCRD